MVEGVPGYLKYRVVNRITGAEIISDLKHPHASTWTIRAMTPGGAASAAIGSFSIPLFAPGSEAFKANWADYKQLMPGSGEGLRVEAYKGDVFGGAPFAAGVITSVDIDTGTSTPTLVLNGMPDPWTATTQRFFPGENTSTASGTLNTVDRFTRYLGENILSFSDQFSPYVAGNYNIVANAGSPTFTASTDANGVNSNVVTTTVNATTAGNLISKTGVVASGDSDRTFIVECIVRVTATTDGNLNVCGSFGLGLSSANNSLSGPTGYGVTVPSNTSDLTSSLTTLTNTMDADGYITVVLQYVMNKAATQLYVNGALAQSAAGYDAGTNPMYPYFWTGIAGTTPPSPSANLVARFTNLMVGTRNTAKVNTTTAPFISGSTDSPVHSMLNGNPQPPTFIDGWSSCAQLEGWFWRYTPVRMISGTNPTMGKVDLKAQPGTDRSSQTRFIEGDNLVGFKATGNADVFGSDLQFNGNPASNSNGVYYARNLGAMAKYGWLSGVGMSLSALEFNAFRLQAQSTVSNMGAPGGSIMARVVRDAATADVWRELDYVTVHCPTANVEYQKYLVLAYTYTEGSIYQDLTLGQYGMADAIYASKRITPNSVLMAGLYKTR